ncbi:MAG: response regulator [Deltaproteobacteria bacterium]|nr:response regulator [Deltaproteobacteria bacterium]
MAILVVDDSPVTRVLLRKTLSKWGFDVLTANDGQEALELFMNHDIRIVITDWMMPNMDGVTLCEEIRKFVKNTYIYIIILTAKDQSTDINIALDRGADDFIIKPLDIERLKVSIKTAQRILSLSENLNREIEQNSLLIENMKEGLFRIDKNCILSFVNNSLCKMLGYIKSELIGKNVQMLHEKEDIKDLEKRLDKRRQGISESYEMNYLHKDGHMIPTIVSAKPIFDTCNLFEGIVAVITDISAIKKAEQERKAIEAQLRQSDKMASIGQLAAGVAHEINNPTGFVSSNLNTLSVYIKDYNALITRYRNLINKMEQDRQIIKYTEQIQDIRALEGKMDIEFLIDDVASLIEESCEGTERIKKIVQDLKDFAHPGEDKPQYSNINKCIESTLNIVWNELKYKVQIKKDYGTLPEILCFSQQLNQVFANIFVNAAQAINDEGEISIKTCLSGQEIEVIISDTGTGIPEENLSKIFDPFFTTKEVGKGTGLGLNVAYNIIKKHNGEISVKSTEGQGTMFRILLPVNNTEGSLNSGK